MLNERRKRMTSMVVESTPLTMPAAAISHWFEVPASQRASTQVTSITTYTKSPQCWQNPRRSGWPEASSDEVGQVWNGGLVWDGEPGAQVVPERHSELLAGFHQAQERIPAVAALIRAGA